VFNLLDTYFTLTTAVLGLIFGSFANVVIYRLPRGESIVTPPSHCPSCGRRLTAPELVPVLSWLFLRGKCKSCGAGISAMYPIIELSCSLLFISMYLYTGASFDAVPLCAFAFVLLCVSVIDARTQLIPDGLLIFGGAVGLTWIAAGIVFPDSAYINAPGLPDALISVITGAAPLLIIDRLTLLLLKKDGFGFGDVKLMAMVGLFIGWRTMLTAYFFAAVTGGLFAVFLLATGRAKRGTYLPFGPFLALGILAAIWLEGWFMGLLGLALHNGTYWN
jgi:leader peptidase (prepilin peptidase)/N-methyltransferase